MHRPTHTHIYRDIYRHSKITATNNIYIYSNIYTETRTAETQQTFNLNYLGPAAWILICHSSNSGPILY